MTVTYNNEQTIEHMIESLSHQNGSVAELVIVDNGSIDRTVAIAEAAIRGLNTPARIVKSSNTGFAGGYETARQHISIDAPIVCINPDVQLADGTLPTLLDALELPDVAIVTAPLRNLRGEEDSASRRKLPSLGSAAAYAAFGKILPRRYRYNSQERSSRDSGPTLRDGTRTTRVEATTGALMLFAPSFRGRHRTLFDLDYWMYGEDLQMCLEAKRAGRSVLIVETTPSIHIKGASSGLPRSRRSDRAFHDALWTYYVKNLSRGVWEHFPVRVAIEARFVVSRLRSHIAQRAAR